MTTAEHIRNLNLPDNKIVRKLRRDGWEDGIIIAALFGYELEWNTKRIFSALVDGGWNYRRIFAAAVAAELDIVG